LAYRPVRRWSDMIASVFSLPEAMKALT
jgi:hypothetical protein